MLAHLPQTDRPSGRQRQGTRAQREELLRAANEVLASDYPAPLGLDDVARRIYTSSRQLQRVYRELDGTSFRAELARVRVERAADLLAATPLAVRTIARQVGYRQPAQFAKAFRRRFGMAPREYRMAARRRRASLNGR
jgi:AraC family transcriptional regulator, regulatory protein of adaptative response / methylphosphotriester-DNA alkyltransferase methyltransferase